MSEQRRRIRLIDGLAIGSETPQARDLVLGLVGFEAGDDLAKFGFSIRGSVEIVDRRVEIDVPLIDGAKRAVRTTVDGLDYPVTRAGFGSMRLDDPKGDGGNRHQDQQASDPEPYGTRLHDRWTSEA